MPEMMFRHRELETAIRLGWLAGMRDALVAAQGHTLDDEQADALAKFTTQPERLRATVLDVLRELGELKL